MVYRQLLERYGDRPVVTGVIGTGHYATAIVTQAQAIPALQVPIVCDVDVEAAMRAFMLAGLAEEDCVVCESPAAVIAAYERGQRVIVPDAALLQALPLDVVVESTGVPEVAAGHALQTLEQGAHLAMVSKEPDALVGPLLRRKFAAAGLVYTAVDGDQHGLLIGMVEWARALGLEVVCGGKARDIEIICDEAAGQLRTGRKTLDLTPAQLALFAPGPQEAAPDKVAGRKELAWGLSHLMGYDLGELLIAANATGLVPDVDTLHGPLLRTPEIPQVLAPQEEGGILGRRGVIDGVTVLRGPHEAGMGGGVFIVVSCANDYSRYILTTKGLIPNTRDTTALIFRPHHLCGVETPLTLLLAGLLQVPTGAVDYEQRFDVLAEATVDLACGEVVEDDHSPKLLALMRPAVPVAPGAPLPMHMAIGKVLLQDVPAGTLLTVGMVAEPPDAPLWALRREQDALAGSAP